MPESEWLRRLHSHEIFPALVSRFLFAMAFVEIVFSFKHRVMELFSLGETCQILLMI